MDKNSLNIEELQRELLAKNAKWVAGMRYAGSNEPLPALGYIPGKDELSLHDREKESKVKYLNFLKTAGAPLGYPPSIDWRNVGGRNYVTPVKDQSSCGSCVAFGTVSTVESMIEIFRGGNNASINLSEAHLFYCLGGATCAGWNVNSALTLFRDQGVTDEVWYPYTPGNQPCGVRGDWRKYLTKISGFHTITNTNDMKTWLATRGPLVTCFTVYQDFDSYHSGIYHHVTGAVRGGHCVSIVGYDDINHCWIAKNSWNTWFGENGYFRIAYGDCGIDATMWAIDGLGNQDTGPFSAYYTWRGNGTVKLNIDNLKIHKTSKVYVAISEFSSDPRTSRFIGGARMGICNITPYEGGVTIWAEINWGSPINICFDLIIYP